ncbi:MAG: 4Fe-4S dicluster domain-containing protein [Thermoleophilia bacterium]|nr:4Fe-4S dicluster domain-containing protein [Thermoleophilia bacterium]
MADKAILFDASRCIGCKGCQVSCKRWNMLPASIGTGTWQDLPEEQRAFTASYQNPSDLRADTMLLVTFNELQGDDGSLSLLMGRKSCMHCTDAACVLACPTGAASKQPDGTVRIDHERCIGCRYCNWACPFGIPKWDEAANTSCMCWMCADRTAEGQKPACVSACPTGALDYGERPAMLTLAKARISKAEAAGRPLSLYGEKEMGGLHVLHLLQAKPSAYGLPDNPKVPDTVTAWQSVVKPVGAAIGALTFLGLGLSYLANVGYSKKQAQQAVLGPEDTGAPPATAEEEKAGHD